MKLPVVFVVLVTVCHPVLACPAILNANENALHAHVAKLCKQFCEPERITQCQEAILEQDIHDPTDTTDGQENVLHADIAELSKQFCEPEPKPKRQCQEPIPEPDIYAPMDTIDGDETATTGVPNAKVMGSPKPSITPGQFSGSIYLENSEYEDDTVIDFGNMRGRCVDNLDMCEDGLTVSLWFWHEYIHDWPVVITGSRWHVLAKASEALDGKSMLYLLFGEGTEATVFSSPEGTGFTSAQWHHVAFVYHNETAIKLFLDGEVIDDTPSIHTYRGTGEGNLQIGCYLNEHCMRGKFDDLKIWEEALCDEDIKSIYNQKNTITSP